MLTETEIKTLVVFLNRVGFKGLSEAKAALDITDKLLAQLPAPKENTDGGDVPRNDEPGAEQPE